MMMKTRTTFEGSHQSLPYDQKPEWVHLSELYHAEKHNLLEVCLEKKFHSEEKVQQKWDALRPMIHKKRVFEKLVYSTLRSKTPRCAFLEDIPDTVSHHHVQKYMDMDYDWIQRIRFRNVGSHVLGICDGLVRTAFLRTLLSPTTVSPDDISHDYLLVFLKPYFRGEMTLDIRAMIRYFRHSNPRISDAWIAVVGKHLEVHIYPVSPGKSGAEEIRRLRRLKRLSPLLDMEDAQLPPQLWPNMKQGSVAWNPERTDIAHRVGEITMLWGCDDRHRQMAFHEGVLSWKDPRFTAAMVGFTETKAEILDRIVRVNRDEPPEKWLLVEEDLETSFPELQETTTRHLFVDFEYFIDDNFIYLIGVWDASSQQYTAFWASERTADAWERMWTAFRDFVETTPSRCWYWYAEKKMMEKTGAPLEHVDETWTDLWEVCRAGVAVRGAFDFSLKSFVRAFHQHGAMPFSYGDLECQDGLASVGVAQKFFTGGGKDTTLKKTLETYNRYDCEAMAYVWKAIRVFGNHS